MEILYIKNTIQVCSALCGMYLFVTARRLGLAPLISYLGLFSTCFTVLALLETFFVYVEFESAEAHYVLKYSKRYTVHGIYTILAMIGFHVHVSLRRRRLDADRQQRLNLFFTFALPLIPTSMYLVCLFVYGIKDHQPVPRYIFLAYNLTVNIVGSVFCACSFFKLVNHRRSCISNLRGSSVSLSSINRLLAVSIVYSMFGIAATLLRHFRSKNTPQGPFHYSDLASSILGAFIGIIALHLFLVGRNVLPHERWCRKLFSSGQGP